MLSSVFSIQVRNQAKKFRFAQTFWFLYNLFIDDKEWHMTDTDFFTLNQEQWFKEFVETELSKKVADTHAQIEIFEFDDVPQ